jgi:mannose-6-phosphate isomerase-like protein (cupin superfamily)
MPLTTPSQAPSFDLPGVHFTGLAAPSRGAQENAVWIVVIAPRTDGLPHQVTREETFVTLEGKANAVVGADTHHLTPGSALVVPPHTPFAVSNPYDHPYRAVVVLPVGGQALVADAPPFTPPWAL